MLTRVDDGGVMASQAHVAVGEYQKECEQLQAGCDAWKASADAAAAEASSLRAEIEAWEAQHDEVSTSGQATIARLQAQVTSLKQQIIKLKVTTGNDKRVEHQAPTPRWTQPLTAHPTLAPVPQALLNQHKREAVGTSEEAKRMQVRHSGPKAWHAAAACV